MACPNTRGSLHSPGKDGRLHASYGKCPERAKRRRVVASFGRSEIHEIAPQDYGAHKRVNGKGEEQ